ncbi:hypothetical protein BH09BAC3_BH09BAC3_14590 [soil metagenome]
MKKCLAFPLFFVCHLLFSQSGPGGVGITSNNPLWLKADAGTSTIVNNTAVGAWNDQSGNSNHATQGAAALRPLYRTSFINGMPTIQFDNDASANADQLVIGDNNNLDATPGLTIFSVSQPNNLNGVARAIISKRQGPDNNESYMLFYFSGDKLSVDLDGTGNRFATATTFVNNSNYLIGMVYDGSQVAASRVRMYVNETFDNAAPRTESSAAIPIYLSNVNIGLLNDLDARPFGGHIAEIIVYSKALAASERLIVSNYLSAKYNIALLAASDLYAGDNAGNGNYDFEVGGIGNDATGSNTSASSAVTGGLGISQAGGFASGDYLIYGHAVGANINSSTDVGGMTGTDNSRWSRIWYFDATYAGVGRTINLTFDGSDSGLNLTPNTTLASNYVLLYRATQAGNWTEVMTASSFSGDRITFGGLINAADGYYTIGTRDNTGSPLPIQLVEFSGKQGEKGVDLSWKTATEKSNDFFTIERSSDGKIFTELEQIPGAGNSTQELNYAATDRAPFVGVSYYRLKQTDYNKSYTYSKIISVLTTESPVSVKLYPNPATNTLSVKSSGDVGQIGLRIFNSQGQSIRFESYLENGTIVINTRDMHRGLYLVYVTTGLTTRAEKIILQ